MIVFDSSAAPPLPDPAPLQQLADELEAGGRREEAALVRRGMEALVQERGALAPQSSRVSPGAMAMRLMREGRGAGATE